MDGSVFVFVTSSNKGFAAVLVVLVTGGLKADNTVRVNQIVTIFLIESSVYTGPNRYPVDTSLIHIESCKSPTVELFEVHSGRISIRHCEY
ncbi:hypothetical protein Tco_0477645 [Tanacetum coccineum]